MFIFINLHITGQGIDTFGLCNILTQELLYRLCLTAFTYNTSATWKDSFTVDTE